MAKKAAEIGGGKGNAAGVIGRNPGASGSGVRGESTGGYGGLLGRQGAVDDQAQGRHPGHMEDLHNDGALRALSTLSSRDQGIEALALLSHLQCR